MRNQSRLQFRSIFRVKVSNPRTNALIGYVGDVSETGLKVLSDTAFEQGAEVVLRLRMRVKDDEVLQFDLDVACKWSGSNAKTGYYEAGFILQEPSAEFALMVEKLRIQRGETENGDYSPV
ncbi:PilZ domain-containing protein [Cellvibrio mixtus]|uniref:PilZ domain-containing protein n=1 Tax=Cellvibrio mixtus TaxID=39650 RepID=UPI000587B406|nr:PilZ domain-containing protein [Cellvibrio mixtus]